MVMEQNNSAAKLQASGAASEKHFASRGIRSSFFDSNWSNTTFQYLQAQPTD